MPARTVAILTQGRLYGGAEPPVTRGFVVGLTGAILTAPTFFLDSVELPAQNTVRARLTAVPKTGTGPTNQRADVTANWTLTGPAGPVPIQLATPSSADAEVADLLLHADLLPGSYVLAVAPTVKTAAGGAVTAPLAVGFVLAVVDQERISRGASASPATTASPAFAASTTPACEDALQRLFNPAFRGQAGFTELLAGIAAGDCVVRQQAEAAWHQYFLASASTAYLTQRAADAGVRRPARLGMADALFRQLAVTVVTTKLTQEAFYEALEPFYGRGAVTAYLETGTGAPFVLDAASTLQVLIDERYAVAVVFQRADFAVLRRATAGEVAAVVTRALWAQTPEAGAAAVAVTDPATGEEKVRIYSGSRGLSSAVRVTGGTAAPALQPPASVFPLLAPPGPLPIWGVSPGTGGRARYQATPTAQYDLRRAQAGDYLVVTGPEFAPANRGSFPVLGVAYTYAGAVLTQYVEVAHPGAVTETVPQLAYAGVQVFRPTRRTLYNAPGAVTVVQARGAARVSVPATTAAVNRHAATGAYLQRPGGVPVAAVLRTGAGAVTATTATAHGLQPGQGFFLDGGRSSVAMPASSGGSTGGGFGPDNEAGGTTLLGPVTTISLGFTYEGAGFATIVDLDKDLWLIGGDTLAAGTGAPTAKNTASTFRVEAETTDAGGQHQTAYRWTRAAIPAGYNHGTAPVVLDDAAHYNTIRLVGGFAGTPWTGPAGTTPFTATVGVITKHKAAPARGLSRNQYAAAGWLAAVAVWLTAVPSSGDALTVHNGVTTRVYSFGSGGDVTVAIGADTTTCMANLAAAVTADSAPWDAEDAPLLKGFPVSHAVAVYELAVTAAKSPLRAWGNAGLAAKCNLAGFADAVQAQLDYTSPVVGALPTANPGYGTAGAHRAPGDLVSGEIRGYLNGPGFVQWTGTAFTTAVTWHDTATTSGTLATPVADAAATWLPGPAAVVVTGGLAAYNKASATIQQGLTAWANRPTTLLQARCQHAAVKLDDTHVLVIGGRQPADDTARAGLGFTSWNFEDAAAATTFAGPVAVNKAGNSRLAGKIGFGLNLSAGASISVGGGAQATLNTALLGSWTITGWMTSAQGCVLRNGVTAWATQADNTLIAFGVDTTDDKFFVRYNAGVTHVTITKKTSLHRLDLGWQNLPAPYPRYHHFALTKVVSGANATFTLYVDGNLADTWTDVKPDGGGNGLWAFGQTDPVSPTEFGFPGCVDAVGFTATVLSASDVLAQFQAEVGVATENPSAARASPIGNVLASCEVVPVNATALLPSVATGAMTYARYAAAVVPLPDGRVVVAGGIGYHATLGDSVPQAASAVSNELRSAEIYSPSLGIWTPLPAMRGPHSYCAAGYVAAEQRVYVAGGIANDRVEYLDLRTMTWHVTQAPYPLTGGRGHGGGAVAGTRTLVVPGGAGFDQDLEPSIYETSSEGPVDFTLVAGSERWAAGGLTGYHVAGPGSGGTTLHFTTPGYGYTAAAGGTVTAVAAGPGTQPGPFTYDPRRGLGLTGKTGRLAVALRAGARYPTLVLGANEALAFPDAPGYLVVNLGKKAQVGPVRYLGRLNTAALRLDAGFLWPAGALIGAEARLLTGKGGFAPPHPETVGTFYATASNAGLAGAQAVLAEVSAAGVPLTVAVRYPGDRGLGAEGYPVRAAYKLSAVFAAFGGDDLDREVAAAEAS